MDLVVLDGQLALEEVRERCAAWHTAERDARGFRRHNSPLVHLDQLLVEPQVVVPVLVPPGLAVVGRVIVDAAHGVGDEKAVLLLRVDLVDCVINRQGVDRRVGQRELPSLRWQGREDLVRDVGDARPHLLCGDPLVTVHGVAVRDVVVLAWADRALRLCVGQIVQLSCKICLDRCFAERRVLLVKLLVQADPVGNDLVISGGACVICGTGGTIMIAVVSRPGAAIHHVEAGRSARSDVTGIVQFPIRRRESQIGEREIREPGGVDRLGLPLVHSPVRAVLVLSDEGVPEVRGVERSWVVTGGVPKHDHTRIVIDSACAVVDIARGDEFPSPIVVVPNTVFCGVLHANTAVRPQIGLRSTAPVSWLERLYPRRRRDGHHHLRPIYRRRHCVLRAVSG